MKSRTFQFALLLAVTFYTACGESQIVDVPPVDETRVTPPPVNLSTRTGPVDDEQSAIAIALAAWIPVYGSEQIERQRPFSAKMKNGVWYVEGSMLDDTPGGVAMARILQKDGRILEIMHGE